jgi:outer membrane protein assembly factor BamB
MPVRRHLTRRCAVTACLALVAGLAPASASLGAGAGVTTASEWQQPLADAARSNRNPGETLLTADKIASKRMRPAYSLAGLPFFGECGGIWDLDMRRPVMAGGNIYAYDGREIEARDLATGSLLWRSADIAGAFGINYPTSVTLAGNRVLVAGLSGCPSVSDPNGFIISFDAADGHTQWEQNLDGPIWHLTVSGSTIVTDSGDTASDPPTFAAYDVTNGTVLWSRGSECGTGDFFIVRSRVVSNTGCGTVKLSTGETLWTKPNPLDWTFIRGDGPSVPNPSIYAKKPNGALVALRPDGTVRWNAGKAYGDVLAAGPVRVFVACLSDANLCALDRLTGEQQWTTAAFHLVGAVTASDFVVLPGDGTVLRASDGEFVGALTFGAWQAAAVADGRVVTVDDRVIDVFELNP